jgi:hypothetical protein
VSVPLLPYIPGGSGKHFKEERFSKVASCGVHHLCELKIVFKVDID